MIKYALKCAKAHEFESWFQSAAAYEALQVGGHVTCPVCGDSGVEKLLMAPSVRPARKAGAEKASLQAPASEVEQAMAALRAQIEANSEYVGVNFVTEARKMHAGDAPERAIYGEAKPEEAKKLIEDGVPVAPLPFLPKRKAN
ncbi:DUF1178 family protein [Pseudotabrizicola sp. L79]|uniref:DUF1178 family protein n=1 Tax=Pseudotabrizicola sp. L79 TaxID=3118402 RepID=UPI002F93AACE